MKTKYLVLIVLVIAAVALGMSIQPEAQQVQNYETEGNLKPTEQIGCLQLSELNAKMTPVVIFNGIAECLAAENYVDAADMYTAAMTYGFFDTLRVSDQTAHQGLMVMRMNSFQAATQEDLVAMQEAIELRLTEPGLCEAIKQLGAPEYHPSYMIEHGMDAFTEPKEKGGLVKDFDAEGAWQHALNTVPKC
ncbi:hypothetical protein [Pseudidiomarina insulisalsae]|uniref:Uncharacterized protein n=1 Tax=Pseudidiomarina insulisalsae TaxID=575789 RepID=A0A432YDI6_9GAMM|nr:hypothetical protein [Pseudidiomarina insulisalsae]RUO59001.1 hypothetical protein CWI71_09275 [Pseudidiomarina insulisalsae]